MSRLRRSDGWVTVEFLVASLLSLLLIALTLEQLGALGRAQRRALVRGANSQAARAALSLMRRSISSAGLAVPLDGGEPGADEAIEGAWERAIVVRGDFDRSTADAVSPEQALSGEPPLTAVTSGNDEVVGWFLGRGAVGAGAFVDLPFFADVVGVPRDSFAEQITLDRVSVDQQSPPYTLYRAHVRDDSAAITRRPIVDGVTRLHFEYFDRAGRPIAAPGGAEDAAARAARRRIRSIAISFEIDDKLDAPRDSGKARQRWRMVVTPANLGLPSRPEG